MMVPVQVISCLDPRAVSLARAAVLAGECLVLPTDTVYGIGADYRDPAAVRRLLAAKQRGRDLPPPILAANLADLEKIAIFSDAARALAARYWPGALTLVLPAAKSLDLGDLPDTVAVRIPDHGFTRHLLGQIGPLAVSSANLNAHPAATTIADAVAQLGDSVSVYLDDGLASGPTPSTIIDLSGPPRMLRSGRIALAELRSVHPELQGLTESGVADA